ncbi:ABC transporter permease [Methanocaldococcus sp.]
MDIKKSLIIAKREVLSNIKRKRFLITTILVPIFLISISIFGSFLAYNIEEAKIGYISNISFPKMLVVDNKTTLYFIKYTSLDVAKKDLINGNLSYIVIVPNDYLKTGEVIIYSKTKTINPLVLESIKNELIKYILKDKVDNLTYNRVINPLNLKIYTISKVGVSQENLITQLLPMGYTFLLYIIISSLSGLVVASTIEEKQNRIIELLLNYTDPESIMIGKIFGISILGLIQGIIWILFALPILFIYAVKISPFITLLAILSFILGYLLYSSLLCGLSSLFSHPRDASQLITPVILIQMIPIMLSNLILFNPNHYIAKILTYFPFTAPYVLIMRVSVANIPINEIILSLTILFVSVIVSFILSIKLFKIGILIFEEGLTLKRAIKIIKSNLKSLL